MVVDGRRWGSSVRILVACEFSGIVREAFRGRGHDAWSCDLLPTEIPGPHVVGDVREILGDGWDLMIAHPPCTELATSGARWWADKRATRGADFQREALDFFRELLTAPIRRVAIENPIGAASRVRAPDQIIQPWQFGHGESKATCLWIRGLPRLTPTKIVPGRAVRSHMESSGSDQWARRSRTLTGIADAMAAQWSDPSTFPQLELF